MNLRGYTADHRFRELALSLVVTRGPLLSSKAINQLEKRQRAFCQPHSTLTRTEERRRTDKTPSFTQRTRGKEVCTVCKPPGKYQGKTYIPDKKLCYHTDKCPKPRTHQKQEHLAAARPVAQSEHSHRRTGGARGDYAIDMESSLQNLSLDNIKEENMIVSQVDGLVDYSSSEDGHSDNSSDGKPHIWQVPDSKTWALHQLDKRRQHPDYEKIIDYRDDGDS